MPYTLPTAAEMKTRYDVFAEVPDAQIEAAIAQAATQVDTTWVEADYQPAIMALAAHLLTAEGKGGSTDAQLAGFKVLRVGPLSLERDLSAGVDEFSGFGSTVYGRTYLHYLRVNKRGAIVVQAGHGIA